MSNVLPLVRKNKELPVRNRLLLERELFIGDGIVLSMSDDMDAMVWVGGFNRPAFDRLMNAWFLTH